MRRKGTCSEGLKAAHLPVVPGSRRWETAACPGEHHWWSASSSGESRSHSPKVLWSSVWPTIKKDKNIGSVSCGVVKLVTTGAAPLIAVSVMGWRPHGQWISIVYSRQCEGRAPRRRWMWMKSRQADTRGVEKERRIHDSVHVWVCVHSGTSHQAMISWITNSKVRSWRMEHPDSDAVVPPRAAFFQRGRCRNSLSAHGQIVDHRSW